MSLELISFFALSFLLAITPGPSVMYVVTYSLRYGAKAGIISTLGINSGSIIAILLAGFGLSYIVDVYPNAITLIQIIGSFYITYLAIRMWPREQVPGADTKNLTTETIENYSRTVLLQVF